MEQKILDELLKDTFTLEVLRKRYQALKGKIEGDIYHQKGESRGMNHESGDMEDGKKRETEDGLEGFDKSLLREIKSSDYTRVSEYIENFIRNLEALSIYFVFVPDEKQIKEVGNWLRQNLKNPRLIFQVKVDPALIGGCAIAYKGVYKDYSLRSKISANKSRLIEEFRKYFRQ